MHKLDIRKLPAVKTEEVLRLKAYLFDCLRVGGGNAVGARPCRLCLFRMPESTALQLSVGLQVLPMKVEYRA